MSERERPTLETMADRRSPRRGNRPRDGCRARGVAAVAAARRSPDPGAVARERHPRRGQHLGRDHGPPAPQPAVSRPLLSPLLRPAGRRPGTAAAERGFRGDRRRRPGLRAVQPPRRGQGRVGDGHAEGQPPLRGRGPRKRSRNRRRVAPDRGRRAHRARHGRQRRAGGRRLRHRHRQPLRARTDRHLGDRERARAQRDQRRGLRGLHPDRRLDQPRQLRRRAREPARRAGRHQHRDHRAPPAATWASASRCPSTSPPR